MDLDYRALSKAGLWCLGRLQTDADRARVLDGLATAQGSGAEDAAALAMTLKRLAPRWFVVRNAHAPTAPILMRPRHAMSLMRGPMTRVEIREALKRRSAPPVTEPARTIATETRPGVPAEAS